VLFVGSAVWHFRMPGAERQKLARSTPTKARCRRGMGSSVQVRAKLARFNDVVLSVLRGRF
jgi:hypothetical protein